MPKEAWDEEGNLDSEEEAEDLLEKPKHVNLLDHSELDSIREFDPINDRIDKIILQQVISESRTERWEVLSRRFAQGPGFSLNGDPGGGQDQYTQEDLQPVNSKQGFGGPLIDDPGESLSWVLGQV